MLAHPIELTPDDNDTLLVTCPLLPIVTTFGENEASARRHAVDAIETALASMIADGEEIPLPPTVRDGRRRRTAVDDRAEGAALLYAALRATGITRAVLARRLGWNRESVDSLFRLDHTISE